MGAVTPDTSVFEQYRSQPEFTELMWQYINRRCSDWRVITGKERAKEYASLLSRVEKDYGVDRYITLALWGMESSFGDVVTNPKYMRPVIPALAALASGEPRRRAYWEAELLNALTIVDRGWAQPSEMIGSWAGAMGHTQWMPEVWLHVGSTMTTMAAPRRSASRTIYSPAQLAICSSGANTGVGRPGVARPLCLRAAGSSLTIAPCGPMPNGRNSVCGAPMARLSRGRAIK